MRIVTSVSETGKVSKTRVVPMRYIGPHITHAVDIGAEAPIVDTHKWDGTRKGLLGVSRWVESVSTAQRYHVDLGGWETCDELGEGVEDPLLVFRGNEFEIATFIPRGAYITYERMTGDINVYTELPDNLVTVCHDEFDKAYRDFVSQVTNSNK